MSNPGEGPADAKSTDVVDTDMVDAEMADKVRRRGRYGDGIMRPTIR
jgi:hypothetical protein